MEVTLTTTLISGAVYLASLTGVYVGTKRKYTQLMEQSRIQLANQNNETLQHNNSNTSNISNTGNSSNTTQPYQVKENPPFNPDSTIGDIPLTDINALLTSILEINLKTNTLSNAAQSILAVLNQFYKMDYVTILILKEHSQTLNIIASNIPSHDIEPIEAFCNTTFNNMNGTASKVFRSDGGFLSYPSAKERGIAFSSFTPLMFKKQVIGAILLENHDSDHFISDKVRLDLYEKILAKTSLVIQNVINTERLNNLTSTDQLTQVHNRRFIDTTLPEQLNIHRSLGLPFSVAIFDIDKFKSFNDTYGHLYGDIVLQRVAEFMDYHMSKRDNDWVARYGGEEFILFFARVDHEHVEAQLERLRHALSQLTLTDGKTETHVTASFGVAHFPMHVDNTTTASDLIAKADTALYHSKETGRNRVTVYNSTLSKH